MNTEPIRTARHLCRLCKQHRCGYRTYSGLWVARADHDVCARCWERLRDSARSHEARGRERD